MEAKYKLDALHIYKVYNTYGLVEAEKELQHRVGVRNLKAWELIALQNEVKSLIKQGV